MAFLGILGIFGLKVVVISVRFFISCVNELRYVGFSFY